MRKKKDVFVHVVADPPPNGRARIIHCTVRAYAPVQFCGDILLTTADGWNYVGFGTGVAKSGDDLAEIFNEALRRCYSHQDERAANVVAVTQARALLEIPCPKSRR